jgi:hypothetical protein
LNPRRVGELTAQDPNNPGAPRRQPLPNITQPARVGVVRGPQRWPWGRLHPSTPSGELCEQPA